jgi:hypothetical protein
LGPIFGALRQLFGSSLISVSSVDEQDGGEGVLGEQSHRTVPETTIGTNRRVQVVHGGVNPARRSCAETKGAFGRAEAHHGQGRHDREMGIWRQELSRTRGRLGVAEEVCGLGDEKLRGQPTTRVGQPFEAEPTEPSQGLLR